MELEKKAAEAHLRGDGGARDAGPGGGNTRDGGDNAEGGHGGGGWYWGGVVAAAVAEAPAVRVCVW